MKSTVVTAARRFWMRCEQPFDKAGSLPLVQCEVPTSLEKGLVFGLIQGIGKTIFQQIPKRCFLRNPWRSGHGSRTKAKFFGRFVKKGAEKLAIIETRLGDAVLPTPDLFRGDTQAQRQVTLRQSEIEARLRQKQIGGVWSHMLVLFLCR